MSYALDLYALPLARLLEELRAPTLDPDRRWMEPVGYRVEELTANWGRLAVAVARNLAEGGALLEDDRARHLALVVGRLGTDYGQLDGGSDGLDRFLPGPAAAAVGSALVGHLIERDIAGPTWFDRPAFGWASNAELREAAERASSFEVPDDEDAEDLHTLLRAVRRGRGRRHGPHRRQRLSVSRTAPPARSRGRGSPTAPAGRGPPRGCVPSGPE